MTAAEFIAHLRMLDIRVSVDGERLRCSAPEGVLTDALRAQLRLRKTEIVAWLRANGGDSDVTEADWQATIDGEPLPSATFFGRVEIPRTHAGTEQDLPLSFAQERIWFLDQLQPGSTAYTIAALRQLHGVVDVAALRQAFRDLARRHESLRTTFPSRDGVPVQRIGSADGVSLDVVDLGAAAPVERGETARRYIQEHAARPFDLASGPLVRPLLITLGPEEHTLCIAVHHTVADGWSLGILARDLAALYAARRANQPASLPELTIRYADFAVWQRRWLDGEGYEAQRQYWRGRLTPTPAPLQLPTDSPRSRPATASGASYDFVVPRQLADELRGVSRREGATLFMTLLAAFKVVLARYCGQDDIAVGTPVANRSHVELEPIIGCFVNTLVLRTDLSGEPSFRELLVRVRETCLGAYAHPDMPFEKLVEALQPERVLGQNPLFQVNFVMQDARAGGDLAFVTVASPFDVTLFVADVGDGTLRATLQYKRDLFEPGTMARLAGHYRTLLESVVADPASPISALDILSEAEAHQLLVEWNDTDSPYPRDRSVHGLFEDEVDAAPDAVALVNGGVALTYRELDRRANQLSHHLRAASVGPEHRVGVMIDRSVEMIVALLGILKAGAAYVPLDLLAPPERLAFMVRNTTIDVVLTQAHLQGRLSALEALVIPVDADWNTIAALPGTRLEGSSRADELVYVTYTSGSTGEPKGVAVTHRNVVRLVKGASYARFGRDEVMLQLTALSFDVSAFEIWGALLNGGRLVMAPPGAPGIAELRDVIARNGVTTMWLTAGLFELVVDQGIETLRPLRQLLAGGDVVSSPHVRRVLATMPTLVVINGYGPTEGTTFACCHTLTGPPPPGHSVPIGRPIANTRVYVLDRQRRPVPIGVPGELWIAGDGVARGYVGRPELTAERFVLERLSPTIEERMYRTGDLVRWRGDGTIDFIGRLDDQVKIRGFRVEPGEVEAALARHPRVRSAAVVARRAAGGDKRLVGYVVGEEPLEARELRAFLRQTLPEYMIPTAFVKLERLPLNTSGKVERRALPEPAESAERATPVEPRDELERRLVEIWREVLSVESVGIHDSFFDLGGHSLLAIRLMARLEYTFGIVLPLAMLFEVSTIDGLARAIRRGTRPASGRSLVAIQPGGDRPPLFVVPGVVGSALGYHRLARLLGPDRPFYGLQSRGLDGTAAPLARIEEIAAAYLREVRELQAEGPYYLVGMCMGGVVAYEMAQQLHADGQKVAFLGLLDTWPPEAMSTALVGSTWRAPALLGFVAGRLRLYAETWRGLRGQERLRYLKDRLKLLAHIVVERDLPRGTRQEIFLHAVTQANLKAFQSYAIRAYPGSVVLFRAEGRKVGPNVDLGLMWRELARGGVEVYSAPGDDSGLMLTDPHVRTVATQLAACLERAELASSRPAGL
jgi:amino acid adenylation domain-containing protein